MSELREQDLKLESEYEPVNLSEVAEKVVTFTGKPVNYRYFQREEGEWNLTRNGPIWIEKCEMTEEGCLYMTYVDMVEAKQSTIGPEERHMLSIGKESYGFKNKFRYNKEGEIEILEVSKDTGNYCLRSFSLIREIK